MFGSLSQDVWSGAGSAGSDNYGAGALYTPISDSSVGPQPDGTNLVPQTAQLVNAPQNTAGYSSAITPQVAQLLSQGIGTLGQLGMANMQLDYARSEATNGGLYRQGMYAGLARNGNGTINHPMQLSTLLLIVGLAYVLLKD